MILLQHTLTIAALQKTRHQKKCPFYLLALLVVLDYTRPCIQPYTLRIFENNNIVGGAPALHNVCVKITRFHYWKTELYSRVQYILQRKLICIPFINNRLTIFSSDILE